MAKSDLGKRGFILSTTLRSHSDTEGSQSRTAETWRQKPQRNSADLPAPHVLFSLLSDSTRIARVVGFSAPLLCYSMDVC